MYNKKKIHALIIDPQRSFCDTVPFEEQQKVHNGELKVPGADQDMVRLARLIKKEVDRIDGITLTLDQHHNLHISHPLAWIGKNTGKHPAPFTVMYGVDGKIFGKLGDTVIDEYIPLIDREWFTKYVLNVAKNGRYMHCIWPPHCLIGTTGACIVPAVIDALFEWETGKKIRFVNKVTKGSNYRTEHFSAVRSEIIDPDDATTNINVDFIQTVNDNDVILLAGEAGSHCLAETVKDIHNYFGDDRFISKCVLLEDCTSPVTGFEKQYKEGFVETMVKHGMKVATSEDVFKLI